MRAHERFFREIDEKWRGPATDKIPLRVIGSAALMLQTDYARGTNDGDVLETASITGEIKKALKVKAAKFSASARQKIEAAGGTCEQL